MDLPTVRVLSLCSGIGGIELGLEIVAGICGFRVVPICMVEREVYAAAVLAKEMEAGNLAPCPVWTDIKTFPKVANLYRGKVDLITAGYPCQPFSVAGRQKGIRDERHIFPDICEIIRIVQPPMCFFENVPNHLRLGFPEVSRSLQELGYEVTATLLRAEEVGAPHRRERLFILAYTSSELHDRSRHTGERGWGEFADERCHLDDPDKQRSQGRSLSGCERSDELPAWPPSPADPAWTDILSRWPELAPALPSIRRVANGLSPGLDSANRIDRLRALGNAVVPMQCAVAFISLIGQILRDNIEP